MKPVLCTAEVFVDFSRLTGPPVSHDRIALFNSGLVPAEIYRRDADFFARTRPEHLRVDLGWGAEWMPWTREVVQVAGGRTVYDFAETDEIAHLLNRRDVRPYWAYSYVPSAVRAEGADWRTMAEDDGPWVDMVAAYAAGAADRRSVRIGYHEVYNEPDLRDERTGEAVFYAGDLDDYLNLYRRVAPAIRAADPAGLIGGPALASVNANAGWLRPFLNMVDAEALPLDFLSFHHYGSYGLASVLDTVTGILAEYPQFEQVELHLNEYNSFNIDYPRGGLQDGYLLASAFAEDAVRLLRTRRVTRTSWAQFLDSGNGNYSGMVTTDGDAKPLLHAYEFFQRMPVDARDVCVNGAPGLGAIASSDRERGAVMMWNRSTRNIAVTVQSLGGLAPARLRLIDSTHSGDTAQEWGGGVVQLERGATVCLEYGTCPPAAAPSGHRRVARARYDYADRAETAWTDVDEIDGTVRFGTGPGISERVLRVGYDLPATDTALASGNLQLEQAITYADGAAAPGEVSVDRIDRGDAVTLWFTLTGAPDETFATVRLLAAEEGAA